MNSPTYNHDAHKREQTYQQVAKKAKVAYRYVDDNDDIVLLSGKYDGQRISELWLNGDSDARDYLFKELWKKDPIAREILVRNSAK